MGSEMCIRDSLKDPTNEDPIRRVRRVYCRNAVETIEQALFIYKYLNLKVNKEVINSFNKFMFDDELDFILPGWYR